jgi:hypothetical protein
MIIDRWRCVGSRRSLPPSLGHPMAPNFKVSNVDKYEPKQDPEGWLAVYTTAVRATRATEDVMRCTYPFS